MNESNCSAARRAVSLVVVSVIIIALILVVAFGIYLNSTIHPKSILTTSSSNSLNSTSYETSSSIFLNGTTGNVTVYGVACTVTYYQVWSVESFTNSSTIGTTSTQIESSSYVTMTNASESIGYATTTTIGYSGTLTGALAEWWVQSCTYGR